jgi:hypothetical protein
MEALRFGEHREMLNHVRRYYPNESFLLELLTEEPASFASLANEYPAALQHLLSLGLVRADGNEYEATTILSLL